jgi:molybdopterin-guanine dinucleotide biosynthesis protein
MSIVVVGGHTRNIGKTSVVAGLIAALPDRHWTAIKITQFGHNVCSANGEPCDCETADHTIAISQERSLTSGTDTARYLAAGAAHSFWVRTRQGQLAEAMPRLRALIAGSENVIIESNSVLRFLSPDIFISVLDPSIADFKPSALRYLDRADALVMPASAASATAWGNVAPSLITRAKRFGMTPEKYCSEELVQFVEERIRGLQKKDVAAASVALRG